MQWEQLTCPVALFLHKVQIIRHKQKSIVYVFAFAVYYQRVIMLCVLIELNNLILLVAFCQNDWHYVDRLRMNTGEIAALYKQNVATLSWLLNFKREVQCINIQRYI